VAIHQQQQIIMMDKQIQQQVQQPITALPMGQTYLSTQLTAPVSHLCLKMCVERIKLSKVLYDYGMKVAAVSILCQDERVFEAMQMAGTPCPFEGKIGKEALEQWNKYDIERPDYDSYVSKLENRSRVDEELAEIERQQEAERVAEEKARKKAELETLKAQEEVDNIIIETDLHTEEVRIINIHE
jgi:hypothetical protein